MKKLLSGLFLFGLVLLPSFSNAGVVVNTTSYTENAYSKHVEADGVIILNNSSCSQLWYDCLDGVGAHGIYSSYYGVCLNGKVEFTTNQNCTYKLTTVTGEPMTSLECQTEYSLIPVSSVDQNYCTSNNLCPAQYTESQCKSVYGLIDESECTGGSGGTGGSLTDLYINNILHVGAPTIFMNIPEEIDWDYAYTNGGNIMNIDVVGYNQDTEYINGLIDINNYKPTSEDFSNVFSNFSNFGGLLVAALFVILVFYSVKKIFK